jgi:hypothetical protein
LRPRTAACTALNTDRNGAGLSSNVTLVKVRNASSAFGDVAPPFIRITTGKSDHSG